MPSLHSAHHHAPHRDTRDRAGRGRSPDVARPARLPFRFKSTLDCFAPRPPVRAPDRHGRVNVNDRVDVSDRAGAAR
ncbi:hypothetical protein LX15_004610 [Streptoalloteichus tenebrarius]|uniref:Uncharacterized protein n=1 Tax=Streptoalloteichus tenebrarius (strain ATCC 17920 / DSM 40477 / JCM 4838 / CBS 697.72 / NBRC 16177 / NCIMB 11028 / NRRL B-12390 / A12253. 1 / ISP 5477) TaxID=1933 RepID=A0ABT1HZD9_STRSD|nr:hypothetical protein [Streptoalloteichus tenebrarius]MCP2260890.1 hypothetical protein [Streptoalloteichus tenebrarius]BFF03350.1 hypothetical protein GCM10020241_50250 [Streptoalloteichus tenebrarius]